MGVYIGEVYKEVEYIQSSGTQYIDTGLFINGDFTTEAKYAKTTNVAWNTLFGTRKGVYCRYLVRCNSDANYFTVQRSYSSANTNTIETYESRNYYNNNIYTVKLNKYLYVDSTLLKTYTTSTTTNLFPYKLYVFALNSSGTASDFGFYKLYYMKIRDDSNNLVRDFVPCYRVSDNEIGLFDKVNNKFYANAGSGTFTKGNDVKVLQPELQNAYIGEYHEIVYDFKTQNVLTFSYRDTNMQYGYTAGSGYYLNKNNNYGGVAVWSLPNEAYVNGIRKLTLYGSSSSNLSAPCMTLAQEFNNSSEGLRPRAGTSYHGIYYRHNSTSYGGDTTEEFPTTDKVLIADFVNNKVSYAGTTIDLEPGTNTTWQTLWANKSFKIGCGSGTYSSGTGYTYLTGCKIEY